MNDIRDPSDWRRDDTLTFGPVGDERPWLIEDVQVSPDKKRVTVQFVAYDAPPIQQKPPEPVSLERFMTSVPDDWR